MLGQGSSLQFYMRRRMGQVSKLQGRVTQDPRHPSHSRPSVGRIRRASPAFCRPDHPPAFVNLRSFSPGRRDVRILFFACQMGFFAKRSGLVSCLRLFRCKLLLCVVAWLILLVILLRQSALSLLHVKLVICKSLATNAATSKCLSCDRRLPSCDMAEPCC